MKAMGVINVIEFDMEHFFPVTQREPNVYMDASVLYTRPNPIANTPSSSSYIHQCV